MVHSLTHMNDMMGGKTLSEVGSRLQALLEVAEKHDCFFGKEKFVLLPLPFPIPRQK